MIDFYYITSELNFTILEQDQSTWNKSGSAALEAEFQSCEFRKASFQRRNSKPSSESIASLRRVIIGRKNRIGFD